ncbi:MAG: DNA primase [Patescibacteria group bacterium]|jgi:DNA primase
MDNQVQEVKDRVDIVEVISSYLTLKKAGSNFKANCPFHNEKTPSMMISPERQSFKCFGCSEGGDVITFIEKIEGLDFFNALKLLADKAGVQLKSEKVKFGDKEFTSDRKTRIYEINEWTKRVYHKILTDHPKAEKAREYLKGRGLTVETISAFEIGYAPAAWDFLLKFLGSKGYTEKEAVEAGVAVQSDNGKIFDRFRGRIIFPISNILGNTVAFTSRILEDDGKSAKYVNSSESPIYIKGKTIYGLDKAKLPIKEANQAVVVEGNMDVIACHQAGFRNTVACSGTALTLDQLKILTRYGGEIVFCFDADNAGQTAMKRAVRIALENDMTTKTISITKPYKDPDDMIKKDPSIWKKAVAEARPSLEYWIDQLIENAGKLDVTAKKTIAKEILPVVKAIFSDIEKEHYIRYLSQKLLVSEKSLSEALNKSKTDREFSHPEVKSELPEAEKLSLVERILGLVWADPSLAKEIGNEFEDVQSSEKYLVDLLAMVKAKSVDKEKIRPEFAAELDQLTITVLKDIDPEADGALSEEIKYLLGRQRSDQKETIKDDFARRIREAEQKGDKELLKKLLQEFSTLIK